jgi:hypothetical protein|tara:strand:+ start:70 stop:504 length:435 start_codon:yes stop_codon:yes gene_type:complete
MNPAEGMVVLQERMVNLVNQLSMPVLECSLVIGRWTNRMVIQLSKIAQENQESLTQLLSQPWDLDIEPVETDVEFELDKALALVDHDRMDILDTLVKVTIEEQEIPLADGLLVLRSWEKLVREQLSQVKGPGQLFSPTDIPEDF